MARVIALLRFGAGLVAAVLFAAMFGAFLLQVFSRYVVNRPLGWTSEVCVILYIWLVFWTCAFLLRERDHVAFNMIFDAVAPGRRRIMAIVGALAIGAGFAASLPAVYDYVSFMKIDVTPVTRIRFDWVYSVFVLFVVAVIVRSLVQFVRLLGPGWRKELGEESAHPPPAPVD